MLLASHNSWSCLKPRRYWQRLFNPFSRCQNLSTLDQLRNGVTLFDLRVRFDYMGVMHVCHGLVDYDIDEPSLLADIALLANISTEPLHVRVLLESRRPDAYETGCFMAFCQTLKTRVPDVDFYGGHGAHEPNWTRQYVLDMHRYPVNACDRQIPVYEKYSSVCATGLSRILPRRWAERNNCESILTKASDTEFLMLDFIGLQP